MSFVRLKSCKNDGWDLLKCLHSQIANLSFSTLGLLNERHTCLNSRQSTHSRCRASSFVLARNAVIFTSVFLLNVIQHILWSHSKLLLMDLLSTALHFQSRNSFLNGFARCICSSIYIPRNYRPRFLNCLTHQVLHDCNLILAWGLTETLEFLVSHSS